MSKAGSRNAAEAAREEAHRLHAAGRWAQAIAAYRRVLTDHPDDFESWNNLGNVYRSTGDRESAIAALNRAADLRPDVAMVRLNLAGALAEAGEPAKSLAVAAEAARLAPSDLAVLVGLSHAHARLGDWAAALASLQEAAALAPRHPAVQLELGIVQAEQGALDEAEAAYRRALRLHPGFLPAYLQLGILLEHSNRADELHPLLEQAAKANVPTAPLGLLHAFILRREGKNREALDAARRAPSGIEPLRRLQLIGEAADRIGDSATALDAFRDMNLMAGSALAAPAEAAAAYRDEIESLLQIVSPEWYARWSPAPPPGRTPPIFLMGFPRSGTTLLDTVLMGHSRLQIVEERPLLQPVIEALGDLERLADLDEAELVRLRGLYFEALDAEVGPSPDGRLVIDKMPLNIARLPIIYRLFPGCRIVFALRHPCDVVLSAYFTNFRLNYAMANFLNLGDAARLYDIVMRCWQRCRSVFPLTVHEIRYEAMVEDLEGSVRPLLAFLGLEWEDGMDDHRIAAAGRGYVSTASYSQVTEPIYGRAIGRWTRYREPMGDVMPLLAPWAERFGYVA